MLIPIVVIIKKLSWMGCESVPSVPSMLARITKNTVTPY